MISPPISIPQIHSGSHISSIELIMTELETKGWVVLPQFLPQIDILKLLEIFHYKLGAGEFSQAKIGGETTKKLKSDIRLSHTYWLDDRTLNNELSDLQLLFQDLMMTINRTFFLSLKRFESQLALYPEGGFYKKHLDQIQGQMHRQLTSILYLNDCEQGGELVLYDREDRNKVASVVKPKLGTFVLFFSSQIFHEVLPTKTPRFSMTSWFRDDFTI